MDDRCSSALGALCLRVFTAFVLICEVGAAALDTPFLQPVSHKISLPAALRGTVHKLAVDRDGIVYILSDRGVARLFGDRIAVDLSYRPLAGKVARDFTVAQGKLYYLFDDEVVCNRDAGKFVLKLTNRFDKIAVNESEKVLLCDGEKLTLVSQSSNNVFQSVSLRSKSSVVQISAGESGFYAVSSNNVYEVGSDLAPVTSVRGLNCILARGSGLLCGTTNGLFQWGSIGGKSESEFIRKIPTKNIRALTAAGEDLWAATTEGLWCRSSNGSFRYFAGKRWLEDDNVLDVQVDATTGNVFALTSGGLNIIEFRPMTLAEKANWYDTKIRQRHIRYGFCSELRLKTPGDPTSAEMTDTDNDGTWSNYYMASQAFRFGATGDPRARSNAWETFEALERLESINPLGGFPSRTFERTGFKVSDPDRWHAVGDGLWDWKAHTSSDEIAAHMFGCSVMWETVAKTAGEKQRIATFITKVLDHIIRHNWYLIDVDGKPTLWARWNPEYVNAFPEGIFDRRLNSAEIVALLQFGYAVSGKEEYKQKAFELFEKHGYLKNILSPMSRIAETPGFKHQGIEMGNEWNHSDDLLGFITYWVLHRYAFSPELAAQYREAIADHWRIERAERCPLWDFVYAAIGLGEFGLEEALWTLRGFPLDTVDWTVRNSHRGDITRLAPNFRGQELAELLPPVERRMTRWNSQPFILDGGYGGAIELAGDEFLLPYWMGRYLKLIE